MNAQTRTTSEDHDPSGRGCALAGRVARGDQEPTISACDACLADLGREDLIWKSSRVTAHNHYATTELDPTCPLCVLAQAFAPISIN